MNLASDIEAARQLRQGAVWLAGFRVLGWNVVYGLQRGYHIQDVMFRPLGFKAAYGYHTDYVGMGCHATRTVGS